jgi:hypothetical protein
MVNVINDQEMGSAPTIPQFGAATFHPVLCPPRERIILHPRPHFPMQDCKTAVLVFSLSMG